MTLYAADDFAVVARATHDPRVAEFVLSCARRYGVGPLRTGVELACGAGLLAKDLAARGIRMVAVDLAEGMLREARRGAPPGMATVRGDLVTFRVRPVDLVTNLGLNCSYVTSFEAMSQHLETVAENLRAGGLYLMDLELILHLLPAPTAVDGPWLVYEDGPTYVARGREGEVDVEIVYGVGPVRYDPVRQSFRATNVVTRVERGVRSVRTLPSAGKLHLPLEVRALAAATGRLEFLSWFADFDLAAPLDGRPDATRAVLVFRRV